MRKRRGELKKNISILQRQVSNGDSINQNKEEIKINREKIKKHLTFTKKFNQSNAESLNEQSEPLSVQPMIMTGNSYIKNEHSVIFDNDTHNEHQKQSKQFNPNDQQTPSFKLKLNSLMKVIYKSEMYLRINIMVNVVYMFGILIELPDKMCYESDSYTFRCGLSYYIQVICLLMICPLFMCKVLRMVGIDSFKCIIELLTFVCGILWVFRPLIILRYLKMLRPLRILVIIRDTSLMVPTYNMFTSVKSISKVLFPALLTIYIYAIIGLYTFSGNEYDRCRDPNVLSLDHGWTVYDEKAILCGQRQCPVVNGTQYQCLNPIDYGVQPDPQELKQMSFGNGLLRYNNIFISLLITYQNTFITGSTNTILLQKQVMSSVFVLIYYYSFIYLVQLFFLTIFRSFIYFNIFYGLMIVNQDQHLQTKEQYQALTDNTKNIIVSQMEKKLIRKYQRLFNRFKKRISILSSTTHKKLPNLIYSTQKNLSSTNLITQKRTGCNLNIAALQQAAAQHEITKQILTIVENRPQYSQVQNLSLFQKIIYFLKKSYYYFNIAIILLSCANICSQHAQQSEQWQTFINTMDIIFFLQFFLDFIVRYFIIVAQNQENHQKQLVVKIPRRIYLQGLLLSVCMTGYLYQILIAQNYTDFFLAETKIEKIFRAMLYLRILILLGFEPYFKESRKLLEFAFEAVKKSVDFIFLWLIVLVMFSMMGYFLFGDCNAYSGSKQCYNSDWIYTASYQGVFESIITTAIIMFNENWDTISQELFLQHGYFYVVWNFIVITFGIMIFSKYFMTYLLNELDTKISKNFDKENFDKVEQKSFLQDLMKQDVDISEESKSQFDENIQSVDQGYQNTAKNKSVKIEKFDDANFAQSKIQKAIEQTYTENGRSKKKVNFIDNKIAPLSQIQNKEFSKTQFIPHKKIQFRKKKQKTRVLDDLKIQEINKQKKQIGINKNDQVHQQLESMQHMKGKQTTLSKSLKIQKKKSTKIIQDNKNEPKQSENSTENYYTHTFLYKMIKSIVLIILVVDILYQSPQDDPESIVSKISYYCSVIIDTFFILDMICQFFVYGLKNWFTQFNLSRFFDLGLNIISILYFTPLGSHYVLRNLYAFRCLRVSYWINLRCQNSQSMRVTAKGFVQLIPKIVNLLIVIWLVYGFFANIIVRLYKQEMWECVNQPSQMNIITKTDCINYGGDWVQQTLNATNFGQALLYIFLLASTEDWMETMMYLSQIKGKDMQPIQSNSSLLRIFFMVFMFFANIIIMNIFIGVCINNFKQIKKKVTGETNLSRQQKQWVNIKNQIYLLQPQPLEIEPQNQIRKAFYKAAKSKAILAAKIFQLVGLLLLLSFITTNMSQQHRRGILLGQYIFLVCGFCIFITDLIGFGIKKQNLNVRIIQIALYAYAIVFLVLVSFSNISKHDQRIAGGVLVAIQLLRNFLFIQQFEFFRKMFNSLVTILPKTKDIFLLMITALFIYTAIGMQIFGFLKPGRQLNQDNGSYVNFGGAIFSLIKFSLWQNAIIQIRDSLTSLSPNSVCFDIYDYESFMKYGQNGCGNTAISILYFITFNLIFSMILLPTLMGIIFDQYNECQIDESASINKYQLQKIKDEWKNFDPQGKGYIGCRDLWLLASKIIKIYKLKALKLLNNQSKQQFLDQLNLSVYEDPEGIFCFQFHQLVQAFTRIILIKKEKNSKRKEAFQKNIPFDFEVNQKNQILKKLKKTPYKSCHIHTLLLLKCGLQSWKNKISNHKKNYLYESIQNSRVNR